MIPDIDRILGRFGLPAAYRRVTLGKGVVGKSTSGLLGLYGVLGLVAIGLILSGNPLYLIALALLAAALYIYFQHSVIGFAKANPASALLEGGDFVRWHHAELGAKDLSVIPNEPPVMDPQNPILLESRSDGK